MTDAERRTRSQLALPDAILQIPERSPLKGARTALRNSSLNFTPSNDSSDDSTDDELLLSPRKQDKPSSSSKRSASPPPQDEYALGSGPSEGRELKRAKRDLTPLGGNETDVDSLKGSNALRQLLLSGHARTHSDSNVAALQRSSTRKRSATTSKKPISTVSASPPPTSFSPPATTPKKDRARSVPLFPSTHDLPRIDFRNIPPSPKRSRSPSRSPSKEVELKQRIPSAMFVGSSSLPTIHDEAGSNMDGDQDKATSSLVAEPIPTEKPVEQGAPLPTSFLTTIIEPGTPTPSASFTSAIPSTLPAIPATPIAQSLNKLMPLSPLTPLPETPLPPRKTPHENADDRFAGTLGWDLGPTEQTNASSQTFMPPPVSKVSSTSKSRLPRPSTVQPLIPSKSSRPGAMGPPPLPTKSKQAIVSTRNTAISTVKNGSKSAVPGKTPRNAFDVLMKKPLEAKEHSEKGQGKLKQSSARPMPPNVFFSSSSGSQLSLAAGSSQSKMKMKNKMRPREKVKSEKPHAVAPISDEEDEDKDISSLDPWRARDSETVTETESEMEMETEKPALAPLAPSEPVEPTEPAERPLMEKLAPHLAVPDPAMEAADDNRNGDEPMSELPAQNEAINAVVVHEVEIPSNSVEAATEIRFSFPGNEVIPETPPRITPRAPPVAKELTAEENEAEEQRAQSEPDSRPPAIKEPVAEENKDEEKTLPELDSRSPSRIKASKLLLGKKRQPISVPPASRVTRSGSNKKLGKDVEAPQPGPSTKATNSIPVKRKPAAVIKPVPPLEPSADVPETDVAMDITEDTKTPPPGSPMRLGSSPAKTPKRKTPMKSPMKFSLGKPASSPSPSKIARSSTLFSSKPISSILGRTFSSDYHVNMGASSSLSTLSNALEKLRMPAPSRPSTSMGFNRNASGDDDDAPERSKDDTALGRASVGVGQPARGLKRASTLGANSFKAPSTTNAAASSSKSSTSSGKNLVQKPLAMFMSNKGTAKAGTGSLIRGTGKTSVLGSKLLFGVGGGVRRTISKKTTLPVVIGSPVKGGGAEGAFREGEDEEGQDTRTQAGDDADVFMTTSSNASTPFTLEDLGTGGSDKGKAKEELSSKMSNASRRVSMVSHALSQSLNMPPPPPSARGLMAPPATPPSARTTNRSASSSYPSTSAGGSSPSTGTRSSARLAKAAEQVKAKVITEGHVSAGKKGAGEPAPSPNPAVEALKILKDCVIFVDVKTDDGEEAGSLFVEMLEGVGARVLTRVGQTCTHIVYKNGLMSTMTRYRLLRDPKPFVVGIGWVVECVEQRKHVEEKDFLVDLEHTNVAGVNKRRRSMLPRLLATELSISSEPDKEEGGEADQSIDGSNSSMTMGDDLAPLERARRRKSIMVGPRA